MAVRVIDISKEVEKEVTCKGCGAILGYTPNDLKRRNGTDYGGGPDGREWINCLNCGKEVTVRSW